MTNAASSTESSTDLLAGQLGTIGASRGWMIAYGIVTIIVGLLVAAWPGVTVLIVAVMFAVQLLILGMFQLVLALAMPDVSGGGRALMTILGILAILVGILCLRAPFQTVAVLSLLLGLFWTVSGVIEILHSLVGDRQSGRWLGVLGGALSLIAGIVVLTYPITSVVTLAWILGIFLVVYGAVRIGRGVARSSLGTLSKPKSSGPVSGYAS